MTAEMWDEVGDWVESLLALMGNNDAGIRLSDAAAELRASQRGARFANFDDSDLADIIADSVDMLEGFGVLGERDGNQEILDPSFAWVKTTASILHCRKLSYRIKADDVVERLLPLETMLGALDADIAGFDALYDSRGLLLDRHDSGRHAVAVPGWVDGFEEGRLAIVWRQGQTLHFEIVDDGDLEADGIGELDALLAWFEVGAAKGLGRELSMGVFELMHHDATSFTRTTPPIDELLLANGLVDRRGWWGLADSGWQTPGEQMRAARIAIAAQRFGLQRDGEQALARLDDIWRGWSAFHNFDVGDRPEIDVAEVRDLFEIELVPLAFFDLHGAESSLMVGGRDGQLAEATALSLLTDEVERAAPGTIAALLLKGRNHEIVGRARTGELAYREVLRHHETNATALVKCMQAAVDASRFDEALRLTQRLMGPGSSNESTLQAYVDAMIVAGRNEPCPCGSGRKYKQCHQGVPLLLEPHATWALIFKLEMFAENMVLSDQFAPGGLNRLAVELIGYPEAREFIVHEGRMIDRFLETRIELLPPTELERLRSWRSGQRSLYETIDVDPGQGMTLRDVSTGEHTEIVERMGSIDAKIGQYLLLRLETIDGVTTSYGQGVLVPAAQHTRVLDLLDDGEIDEWLEWFAGQLAPPELTTSDGDALMLANAVISTAASVSELSALLDDRFGVGWPEQGPARDREWTATRDGASRDGSSVLASMRIVDGCVELSTMSAKRHDHFVDELLEILPAAQLVDESIEPPDLTALAGLSDESTVIAGGLSGGQDLPDEIQEVMDKHILKMEANWLHENIPALGGLTPFEALDDPTRRPDLIRLLNTMPSTKNTFDADRLRAALGLAK